MAYYPNTTKKARDFCSEEMAGKSVDKVPGIGPVLRGKQEADGDNRAEYFLQKARELNFDQIKFQGWLTENYGASPKHAADCFSVLRLWEDQFGHIAATSNREHGQSRERVQPCNLLDEKLYTVIILCFLMFLLIVMRLYL